jgi:hypothetical protein
MSKTLRSLFVAISLIAFINNSFGQGKIIQGVVADKLSEDIITKTKCTHF